MAFVTSSTFLTTSSSMSTSTTKTVTAPATISVGNTLIAYLYTADNASTTTSWSLAGWSFTAISQCSSSNAGALHIGIKTAVTADTTAPSYAFAGTNTTSIAWYVAAAILNYTGLGSTLSTTPSANNSTSSSVTTNAAPAVSPAASTNLLLACFGSLDGVATSTIPAGMTSRANAYSSGNETMIVLDQTLSASGTTGTRTQTFAGTDWLVGSLMTISPAGAAGSLPTASTIISQAVNRSYTY